MPEVSRRTGCSCKEIQLDGCRLQAIPRQRRRVNYILIYLDIYLIYITLSFLSYW